jgi:chitinase
MLKNVTFSSVDLTLMSQFNPRFTETLMRQAVQVVATRKVRPVRIASAPLSDVETVFPQIQAGNHKGKLVLTASGGTQVKVVPLAPKNAQFVAEALYLVIGGLDGLGQTLLSWMADHSARHLITMSRSGLESPKAQTVVDDLKRRGVTLTNMKCNVADFCCA